MLTHYRALDRNKQAKEIYMNLGALCKIMRKSYPMVRVGESSKLIDTENLFPSTSAIEKDDASGDFPTVIANGVLYTFMPF